MVPLVGPSAVGIVGKLDFENWRAGGHVPDAKRDTDLRIGITEFVRDHRNSGLDADPKVRVSVEPGILDTLEHFASPSEVADYRPVFRNSLMLLRIASRSGTRVATTFGWSATSSLMCS